MKRRLWLNLALVLAIVLVIGGIVVAVRGTGEQPTTQRTVTVGVQTVTATASATGAVVSPDAVTLAFASPGLVTRVKVQAGDQVRAGQVLARIDATVARQQLASAQSSLAQARSSSLNADEQFALTEQSVQASEASLEAAVVQAQSNLDAAERQWSEACLNPDDPTCPNPAAAESIRQAQNALTSAQLASDIAVQNAAGNVVTYDLQVNQAAASLAQAQATASDRCSTSTTSVECKSAQNAVLPAQQAYDTALNSRTQNKQRDEQSVRQASMKVSDAQVALRKIPADYRKAQQDAVRQAKQALTNAKAARQKGQIANAQQLQTARAALQAAAGSPSPNDAAVAAAEAAVAVARQGVEDTVLRAPMAGTVGAINLVEGESSAGSATAAGGITLVPDSAFQVEADFAESDAAAIQVGQPASLTFEGLPGTSVTGVVVSIDPVAATSAANSLVTFAVRVAMDEVPAGLKQGMTATVAITTERVEDVLAVPQSAITTIGETSTVEVLQADGTSQRVEVTTGVQGDTYTEITSGLTEGQELVIPTASTSGFPTGGIPGGGPMGGSGGGTGAGRVRSGG